MKAVAVALIALLILGIIGSVVLYFGPALCIACPNSVGFDPAASKHTLKIDTLGSSLVTITVGPVAAGTNYGGVTWPIANAATSFQVNGPLGSFGTWLITLPSDQSSNCYNGGSASSACLGGSYQFTSTVSNPVLLSASNNAALYAVESTYLPSNPYTFNATYTSSSNAPVGCTGSNVVLSTSQSCVVQWSIYRYYFTVNMQTQGATLNLNCAPGASCQDVSCFLGQLCNTQQYTSAFQSGVQGALNSAINPSAFLTSPTQLDFQLGLPPNLSGQSNLDEMGIINAFTLSACAGSTGGIPVGDLCETNCGGASNGFGACTILENTIHTSLPMFSDAAMNSPYSAKLSPFIGVSSYSAAQLAAVTPSSLLSTVYAGIHITQFGAQFQMNSGCFITAYQSCFAVSQPQAVLTVGMDVLSSTHSIKTYPSAPGPTGTNAGSVDGQVIDGSLPWHPGVAGASVCFTDITGCSGVTSSGNFNFTNVAAGTHTIQITAPLFYPSASITVNVPSGGSYHVGQVSIAESNPFYLAQFCFPNPLGFALGSQICIPYIIIFGVIIAAVAAVVVVFRVKIPKIS